MKRSNSPTLVTLVVAALSGPAAALEINLADSFEAADPADFGNVIGQVAVVPAGGVLASVALAFNTSGNEFQIYDQIGYSLHNNGQAPQRVSFAFDLLTVDLIGTNNQFVVLFDTPQVRNVMFTPDGNIEVLNPGPGGSGIVGSFADRQTLAVDMQMDTAANLWELRIGGALLYSDTVDSFAIGSIRLSHARFPASPMVTSQPPATSTTWSYQRPITSTSRPQPPYRCRQRYGRWRRA